MPTPVTTYHDPSPGSVFIPSASGQIQIEFSRNPNDFPLAQYLSIVPVEKIAGYYPQIDTNEANRIDEANEFNWPDGQERPKGRNRPFRWRQWVAERKNYSFQIGQLSVNQSDFDVVAAHARGKAKLAMTDRTIDATTVLTTSGNWPTGNTAATVDALLSDSGTSWYSSSTTNQYIKKSLLAIKEAILKATGGVVKGGDLMLVVNPDAARQMATTAEISAYLTQHEQALASLNMRDAQILNDFGLPPYLYGMRVVIENAVRTSSARAADDSSTQVYCLDDDKAVVVARPDGIVGTEGVPSFSTLTGFFQEEMTVEAETDQWNRLTKGAVVDNRDIVLTAPAAGYLVQDIST